MNELKKSPQPESINSQEKNVSPTKASNKWLQKGKAVTEFMLAASATDLVGRIAVAAFQHGNIPAGAVATATALYTLYRGGKAIGKLRGR